MNNEYLPAESKEELMAMLESGETDSVFEAIAAPLHEELYRRQDFSFLDELSSIQRTVIAFDYVQSQVGQGGFIQLIQNSYVSLLVTVIEGFQEEKIAAEMSQLLDDVLKVYVLNREALDKETSVEEFSKLYEEFKEFEALDQQFIQFAPAAKEAIIRHYLA